MADRFADFASLDAGAVRGVDYRVRVADRGTAAVILAPHGGDIEPGTSEIAAAMAGDDVSFYAFEGVGPGAFAAFHITSHRFDELEAVALVGRSDVAIAIHGRRDDGSDAVWLGGRDGALRDRIGAALREAGFGAERNKRLPGEHPRNICNRTRTGAGVQLELPMVLRRRLLRDAAAMGAFCAAVRATL